MMKMLSLTKDWSKISLKNTKRKLSDPQLYPEVLRGCKVGLCHLIFPNSGPGADTCRCSVFSQMGSEVRAVGDPVSA